LTHVTLVRITLEISRISLQLFHSQKCHPEFHFTYPQLFKWLSGLPLHSFAPSSRQRLFLPQSSLMTQIQRMKSLFISPILFQRMKQLFVFVNIFAQLQTQHFNSNGVLLFHSNFHTPPKKSSAGGTSTGFCYRSRMAFLWERPRLFE
jgi:hypothetical protein